MNPQRRRIVAIGDLNGSVETLRAILRGLELSDGRDRWTGGDSHLIQVGDIFNRGAGARDAFALLDRLAAAAPRRGGRVTVLLGNHEVMTTLKNEAYCTTEEYLSFATDSQRAAWPAAVQRALRRIYRDHPPTGPIPPLMPRLEAWKATHAPGRAAMRRALGPRGELGRAIRRLPVAVSDGDCVFVHAPLTPDWASAGIDGLNQRAARSWAARPRFDRDLDDDDILSAESGPLWNRDLVMNQSAQSRSQIERSLRSLGARRMIVGHTQTGHIPGGRAGHIALRHGGRLVCIDVGLGRGTPSPVTALVIERGAGHEWSPRGRRRLWSARR